MAAYGYTDNECDSTFGEDCDFWSPMLSPPSAPVAGPKRDADNLHDPQTTAPGLDGNGEHRAEHIDPQAPGCHSCMAQTPCAPVSDSRPSKRRASALKVSEFHGPVGGGSAISDADQQFYDQCFHELCKGCDFDNTCNTACSLPCPGEGACSPEDVCFDPHCEDSCDQDQCLDKCVDPECTKIACPNDPCFCQDCGAQPCPLGDLGNECHLAHSAPTSGTIYCFDNAPCHFQAGVHYSDPSLAVYNNHPCFSPSHNTLGHYDITNPSSSAATPALSSGNFSSMGSYSHQATPMPSSQPTQQCFFGDPSAHCHLDPSSCCHGPSRDHGQFPTCLQDDFSFWDPSFSQSGLGNALTNFGFQTSQPTGTLSLEPPTTSRTAPSLNDGYHDNMHGFDNSSWIFNDSHFSPTFPVSGVESSIPLDYLASAAFKTSTPFTGDDLLSGSGMSTPIQRPLTSCSSVSSEAYVCKWKHSPGMLCGLQFASAELLHKHVKMVHVDNCASCFCQWEGCEACEKDFKQRSKLNRHLLGHAGYRPYACSFAGCDKTFATNQAKENHERVHTGDKPYKCEHPGCDYRTTTHTQLQTHIAALHQKKKIHQCRFCSFTCADSSNLSKHERTHQTLRPYRCPHPGCTFKPDCRWENLKRHLRRSNHCPDLLIEGSVEYKEYRENVKREIDEWHKRNEAGTGVVNARRKGKKE
ncbi:hypothetical protein BDV96DRAFT_484860 [Lophiotrema nucula]|uniref:C2H2-type domain-containing protein n=1 Tax=Lophiotrema nucula TaxID=690887 RepID=A0A6A5ZMA3_9PLEO|nr:hypothetical protein BDV96DRAFT_484860 [Lophiotrema nucula]